MRLVYHSVTRDKWLEGFFAVYRAKKSDTPSRGQVNVVFFHNFAGRC